jgi:hypothetical protein
LIYKTALLTGLRARELRTLCVGDLSFGDVPFLTLRHSNEKSRKGSTVPLKSDLARELSKWVQGKEATDLVFKVPTGLLRILNRDLVAAGIDKIDELGRRVHVHALRHSTGTHLSAAGVARRTAQAVMRHSDLKLTMETYTDEQLLDKAGAVEMLPTLPLIDSSSVPPHVPPKSGNNGQNMAELARCDDSMLPTQKQQRPGESFDSRAFDQVELKRFELSTSALRTHIAKSVSGRYLRCFLAFQSYPISDCFHCFTVVSSGLESLTLTEV